MPEGSLLVQLTDVTGAAVADEIEIEFIRASGEPGTGGANAEVTSEGGVTSLTVSRLACRAGIGTQYRVRASTEHYKTYGFLQQILEDRRSHASDDVEFWVKPSHVRDIDARSFGRLPQPAQDILANAAMVAEEDEDEDLLGLQGAALYDALGPLRKACFLNLVTKAADAATTGDILDRIRRLLVARQDRFFAEVDPGLPQVLQASPLFKSADQTLHAPLPGYRRSAAGSFKSHDAHANIQVSFMTHVVNGTLAADVDIDESSGIRHGLEVIENAVFRNRTNPYLIREFMAMADRVNHTLVPPYAFVF